SDESEFEQLFIPWLVFNWTADPDDAETPDDWPDRPLALACLEREPSRFDTFARRFLEVACARPYSFYVVTRVERGRSLGLRDVITGREFDVLERQARPSIASSPSPSRRPMKSCSPIPPAIRRASCAPCGSPGSSGATRSTGAGTTRSWGTSPSTRALSWSR